MNTIVSTTHKVAVDQSYEWQPMSTCPMGAKVQLLGHGMVATYGTVTRGDTFWRGWAPLPKVPDWMQRDRHAT